MGWVVPRMARELHTAARDSGEDVAAHHDLVKMIAQWEQGNRVPRGALQATVLEDLRGLARRLVHLPQDMALGMDVAQRLTEACARAASRPRPGEIEALRDAALARPRKTVSSAEIRALSAEAIAHLHEVAGKLAQLSALLGSDEASRTSHKRA
jgi:DNA-binding transcriptional regulator YiaG